MVQIMEKVKIDPLHEDKEKEEAGTSKSVSSAQDGANQDESTDKVC